MSMPRLPKGFTLTEVLITVGIIALMVAMGAPSLADLMQSQRLDSRSNDLLSSLLLARSEAVTRNTPVALCPIDPDAPEACDSDVGWQSGWIAFEDDAAGGVIGSRDVSESILDTYTGMGGQMTVVSASYASYIRYLPSGGANDTGTFNICVEATTAMDVVVNATGHPRLADADCEE
ncbi:MAG: GspH/FimT family pseudopilin [Pseudomonadota bacterium]